MEKQGQGVYPFFCSWALSWMGWEKGSSPKSLNGKFSNFRELQRKEADSKWFHGDGRIAARDPKKVVVLSLDTPGRL